MVHASQNQHYAPFSYIQNPWMYDSLIITLWPRSLGTVVPMHLQHLYHSRTFKAPNYMIVVHSVGFKVVGS